MFQVRLSNEYTLFHVDSQCEEAIQLPHDIAAEDFITILQGSLDKIKPVILLASLEHFPNEKMLKEMSRHHFSSPNAHLVFLNFSIRNKLVANLFSEQKICSFETMRDDLVNFFAKK